MATVGGEVTLLLSRLKDGDQDALARLIPIVYKQLRRLAGHYLREERIGHTLQPTALVHEVYLRLVGQQRADWQNREQFMAVAAQLMRRILPDPKVFGQSAANGVEEVLSVDEALTRLAQFSPQQSRVVEMRYFGGLTVEESAKVLRISPRTVDRDWAVAKAWLHAELKGA